MTTEHDDVRDGADEQHEQAAPSTAVAEYSPTAVALADLRHRFQNVAWNVTTTKGMTEARQARKELRDLRVGLEDKRVQLKAPLLEQGKTLDNEAKRIQAEIVALETPIDQQIKAEEERKEQARVQREAEEKARELAERERVQRMTLLVDGLRRRPLALIGKSAAQIVQAIIELQSVDVDGTVDPDYRVEALAVIDEAVTTLTTMRVERQKADDEARRNREEKAEQERLQREAAERLAAENKAAAEVRAEADRAEAARREQLERDAEALKAERRAVRDSRPVGAPWYPIEEGEVEPQPEPVVVGDGSGEALPPVDVQQERVAPAVVEPVASGEESAYRISELDRGDRPPEVDGFRRAGQVVGEHRTTFGQTLPLIAWEKGMEPVGTWLYVKTEEQQ